MGFSDQSKTPTSQQALGRRNATVQAAAGAVEAYAGSIKQPADWALPGVTSSRLYSTNGPFARA